MTTRQETKATMTKDAAIAYTTVLLKKIKYPKAAETAKAMIEKYGVAGYDMAVAAVVEPYVVTNKLGIEGRTSRSVITYLNTKPVTEAQATKIAGKKVTVKGATKQTQTKKPTQQKKPAPTTQKKEAEAKKKKEEEARKKKEAEAKKKKEEEAKKKASTPAPAKKTASTSTPRPSPLKPEKPKNQWTISQPNIKPQITIPEVKPKAKTRTDRYNELSKNGKQSMDLNTLMKECGITSADVQNVLSKNPNLLSKIQSGATTQKVSKRADNKTGAAKGLCLGGVQGIMEGAGVNILATNQQAWKGIPPRDASGKGCSGCDTYRALENTGKYITVTYPSSKTMDVIAKVKPGTPMSWDSGYSLDKVKAARKNKVEPNPGQVHGHTAVKRSDGRVACDGVQNPADVSGCVQSGRYGSYMHVSVAKDDKLPKELVDMLIKEAEQREKEERKKVGILYKGYSDGR